jgi:leucyl aminopeptidase (aminopeptidase T)
MELLLGYESRPEFYSFEMAKAARKFVEQIMLVTPGEHVVITADTGSDARVVNATAQAVYAADASPIVIWYERRPNPEMEPPPPVAEAVSKADVWIEYVAAPTYRTAAQQRASANGCRFAPFNRMDVDAMVRTIGRVDYSAMMDLGYALARLTQAAEEIRITGPSGTDFSAQNGGREVPMVGGIADEPGKAVMLGGQVGWLPVEESIQGTLVFDASLGPPDDLGVLKTPIVLTLQDGRITNIEGGEEARAFDQWLGQFDDPNMYRLAHLSYGFNPGVTRATGRIVEDERLFGGLNVGFGSSVNWKAKSHTDGITKSISVWLDGDQIEETGRYVHPELIEACRRLGVPGY